MNYEKSYLKLEEIVEKLEEGTISLDEALKLYEEGIKLYRICNNLLENAQLKVSKVSESGEEFDFEIKED